MFEPACRGGSKRSLNISNPTPKWPRSPGEMVSAPAPRRGHTRALTLTHTGTAARGPPRAHCPPAARPPPRPRWPWRLCVSPFSFHLQFAFCRASSHPPFAPGKASGTSPGRIFPELLRPPGGEEGGPAGPAWLLHPGSRAQQRAQLRPGPRRLSGLGQRPSAPALAGPWALPSAAAGTPGQAFSPVRAPLPAGRKFT